MPDVRWPTDWEVAEWGDVTSPTLSRAEAGYALVLWIPTDDHGHPDLDGLLARLRLDPAEVEGLLVQIDVARRLVDQIDAMDRDFDIAPDPEFDDYAAAWDQLREIAREFKRLRGEDRA